MDPGSVAAALPAVAGLPIEAPFRRGSGPLVSILLPTRNRPNFLWGAVESIYNMAAQPDQIETIIKVDDDDDLSRDVAVKITGLMRGCPIHVVSSPRGKGYQDFHHWCDEMLRHTSGDWFMVWNDDARIITPGWDSALANCGGGFADGLMMFMCRVMERPGSNEFLFVRREYFDVLGHISLSPHVDTWMATIHIMLQRAMYCPVAVCHLVNGFKDATGEDKRKGGDGSLNNLFTTNQIRQKLADLEKLLAHIERFKK